MESEDIDEADDGEHRQEEDIECGVESIVKYDIGDEIRDLKILRGGDGKPDSDEGNDQCDVEQDEETGGFEKIFGLF